MQALADNIEAQLIANNGKIGKDFINNLAEHAEVIHHQMTANTRVCVIKTYSGHEVVGYSQVLDSDNDVEEIGQQVAFDNAKDKLWQVCGAIAKII